MIPLCLPELSIFTSNQNTPSMQRPKKKMMSMIVPANTQLSVRLVIFNAGHFLCSSSTSLSSPKSGWLQLDWTLYKRKVICGSQRSLCYDLAWTWHSLDYKPFDTNLQVTPAISTKKKMPRLCLTTTPMSSLVQFKQSFSMFASGNTTWFKSI